MMDEGAKKEKRRYGLGAERKMGGSVGDKIINDSM